MVGRAARHAERGQTLPLWALSVVTALTLMFFVLNYANVLRAQVRAQDAADTAAQAMLGTQARRWNEVTVSLYALDVEEWRIRSLMQALIDALNYNGGCKHTGVCPAIYAALLPQLYKAVNRYTADMYALQSFSYFSGSNRLEIGAAWDPIYALNVYACAASPLKSTDCALSYDLIDFSFRTPASGTWPQVAKNALYAHVGGSFSATNVTPQQFWQPEQLEVAACVNVPPLVNFSIFGFPPQTVQIVGRAAAALVPITTEWLAPGVTINPNVGSFFQPVENYAPGVDTFDASASPRDWYETSFPAQPYTPNAGANTYTLAQSMLAPDFEVYAAWWGVIPIEPYTTTTQTPQGLCTQTPSYPGEFN